MREIILAFFALAGSLGFSEESQTDVKITLQRTGCFGSCPVYTVTIQGNGSVTYEGTKYVRVVGQQHSSISSEELEGLVQTFLDIHYFDLQDRYSSIKYPDGSVAIVHDSPMTYTSLDLNGQHKEVEDSAGAPKELEELERKIDLVVNTKRWVTIDPLTVHDEVRHGWNVNGVDAQRLFFDAVRRGDDEVVQAFIVEGVDVNVPIGGLRPLQLAGGSEVVKELIAAGADVNVTSAQPPLDYAAERGDVESIQSLLNAGAKVNGSSSDKISALMKAANRGNVEAVRLLLSAGADVHLRDSSGETAFDYAKHWLQRQQSLEKYPHPFEDLVPDYETKFGELKELLLSSGSESKH